MFATTELPEPSNQSKPLQVIKILQQVPQIKPFPPYPFFLVQLLSCAVPNPLIIWPNNLK